MNTNTTRRGLLGLFAAAVPAVVLAAPIAQHAQVQPQNWRTKHPSEWTKADCVDEAEYQIDRARKSIAELKRHPATPDNAGKYRAETFALSWWERELANIHTGGVA